MTWETERIVTGEVGTFAEYHNNTLYEWGFGLQSSLADRYTGDNALYSIGPATGIGHRPQNVHTTIRIGFWFRTEGWWRGSNMIWLDSWNDTENAAPFQVRCDDFDSTYFRYWTIGLPGSYTNVAGTTDAYPLASRPSEWRHIGFDINYSLNRIAMYDNGRFYMSASFPSLERATWIGVCTQGAPGGYTFVDNVYFDFETASMLLECPPARRYYYALPDGAGTYSQWTPTAGANYENVDDDPIPPDDDTTIVSTDTNAQKDTYTFAAVSGLPPMTVISGALVQAYVRMYGEDGWGQLSTLAKIGGSELESDVRWVRPERISTQDSDDRWWSVVTGWFDDKPGGGEWTLGDFNSAEFGIKSGGLV